MEKRVAGVLHDARRHGADILLDMGRALRLGGLVNGKKVSLRRAGCCWRIQKCPTNFSLSWLSAVDEWRKPATNFSLSDISIVLSPCSRIRQQYRAGTISAGAPKAH